MDIIKHATTENTSVYYKYGIYSYELKTLDTLATI